MNDFLSFNHGEEGTHYACAEMANSKGETRCCECTDHQCQPTKSESSWEIAFDRNWNSGTFDTISHRSFSPTKIKSFISTLLQEREKEVINEVIGLFKIDDKELHTKERLLVLSKQKTIDSQIELARKRAELTAKQQWRAKLNAIKSKYGIDEKQDK